MQLYHNNWAAQLTTQASASTLQLQVSPALAAALGAFDAGDYTLLTLAEWGEETVWEIVRVIGADASTGVLTVAPGGRGQEGTAARIWSIGTPISARVTRGTLESLRDNAGAPLSDAAPLAAGDVNSGTSAEASRADHVHAMPTAEDVGADPQGAAAAAFGAAVQRGNHEGTQPIATVEGLAGELQAREQRLGVMTVSGSSLTLALEHLGQMLELQQACIVTVPPATEVAWPGAGRILLCQAGEGEVSVVQDGGVSVLKPASRRMALAENGAVATLLIRPGMNSWRLFGDLAPAEAASGTELLTEAGETLLTEADEPLIEE
ncbi:hypothetical protein EA796_00965 [Pseudomonas sp. AOB-7]|uniref:hypothetical protein n=1 Tax=Pseudomonas sp. AOB-7 TaxID=2482750 RepID=UPI000EFBED54|nr:hypothetical protein [Pseudomonas sp. AOB-7]RMH86433.1 hypothetical protein EA796_00965 [Pseudomonas sp. AOB-7]